MKPQRIVSLVPSLTELVFDLGLGSSLSGRTRFCVHPSGRINEIPVIGGTKNPRLDRIREIEPDLIIANREENRKEDVEALEKEYPVFLTDIKTIEEALLAIYELGKWCDAADPAEKLISQIQQEMENIPDEPPLEVIYLIWKDPWMSVGGDTYINSVLRTWKLYNKFENDTTRYPPVVIEYFKDRNPDYILLSSEPYPFKEKHKKEILEHCPSCKVLLVDGQWFSWYGSRMLHSFRKLNTFRRAIS